MTGRTPQELVLHWNKLKSERGEFERTWQEIADYVRPLRAEFTSIRQPGEKRHQRIFDATPLMAADGFAGGIYGMMTNPANRWFALRLADDELNDFDPVRDWLYDVETKILHSFGPQVSRFYSVLPSMYADLACFGTAVFYNIAANQADPIRWMTSASDLVLGTLSQEFAAFGGGLGDPITPSNTRIVPQSGEGSNGAPPVKAGVDTLFVNRAGRKIFALVNESDAGSYIPLDLQELADHLTLSSSITRIAWAKNPASLLWALRDDGTLIALTYRRDQKMYAWTKHPLSGAVESIAVIPSADSRTDDLWLIVNRTIGGQTRRYVEYLAPPFEPADAEDKELMGFLDSALRYKGAPTSSLSGLFHLEGQTVRIVADGAQHADRVVIGGKVLLDKAAENVWAGLAYTSRVRTLRLDVLAMGTAQGKTKRIPRVTVRVHNAIGGAAGPGNESLLEDLVRREQNDGMDASPPMRSGDVDVYLASDFDLDCRIAIVQADPMPLDILSIMPLIAVADG